MLSPFPEISSLSHFIRMLSFMFFVDAVYQAPVVSRSDCTEITCNTETLRFRYKNNKIRVRVVEDSVDIEFNACQGANGNNNDLYAYYQRLVDEGLVEDQTAEVEQHIVGNDQCPDAIEGFLTERLGELGININ